LYASAGIDKSGLRLSHPRFLFRFELTPVIHAFELIIGSLPELGNGFGHTSTPEGSNSLVQRAPSRGDPFIKADSWKGATVCGSLRKGQLCCRSKISCYQVVSERWIGPGSFGEQVPVGYVANPRYANVWDSPQLSQVGVIVIHFVVL